MVDLTTFYSFGNVSLEVKGGKLGVTVVGNFYEKSGEMIRKQVAEGNIATGLLDFWRCIADIAEQKKETQEIMRAIDMMIEKKEE